MALPEANIEMVVMARNLQNDCIAFSIPGGPTRDGIAIAILLSKPQRAKIVEVHRQGPAIVPSLRWTYWRRMREIPRQAKPWLCYIPKHSGGAPEEETRCPQNQNVVTSLAPGKTL